MYQVVGPQRADICTDRGLRIRCAARQTQQTSLTGPTTKSRRIYDCWSHRRCRLQIHVAARPTTRPSGFFSPACHGHGPLPTLFARLYLNPGRASCSRPTSLTTSTSDKCGLGVVATVAERFRFVSIGPGGRSVSLFGAGPTTDHAVGVWDLRNVIPTTAHTLGAWPAIAILN